MSNCIKCNKYTSDKTRIKNRRYLSICRSHKSEIIGDREILDQNKQIVQDYQRQKTSDLPEMVKDLLKIKPQRSPTWNVYANYLAKREIKLVTKDDLRKYEELKAEEAKKSAEVKDV